MTIKAQQSFFGWRSAFLLLLLIMVTAVVTVSAGPVMREKGSSSFSAMSFPSGIGSVENTYLKLTVNDENNANYASRFSLRTTGGDPDNTNDNNQRLLYGYDNPWSSFTTVRIDGVDSAYGMDGCVYTEIPTTGLDYIRSTCLYGTVQVTQKLTFVQNPQTGRADVLEIRYVMKNTGQTSKSVGLREELDTMLGANDGAPFQVPGTGAITTETEFLGASVPDYWLAFDSLSDPTVLSQGTLRGGDATPPDRVVFAAWPSIRLTYWDYPIDSSRVVTGDSAVGLYWNPETLGPDSEVEYVTYYGLSSLTQDINPDMSLSVSAPLYLDVVNNQYSPNPFTVTAFVQNSQDVSLNDVTTTISLPPGLTLAGGSATQVIGTLDPDEIGSVSWQVMAADQATGVTLPYTVSAIATDVSEKTVTRSITLPAVTGASMTVKKSASVSSLTASGGEVTYTYLVENTGSVPLSGITLTDDKLGVIPGPASGDTNNDGILDAGESWKYTATTTLTTTMTNTATVSGSIAGAAPVSSPSNAVTVYVGEPIPTPEFTNMAIPTALLVGMLCAVFFIKRTKEN